MTEPVRERVLDNLKTTLEGMTTVGGYNFDFTSSTVQRWSMLGNSLVDLPAIVITSGPEEQKSLANDHEDCSFTVYIDAFYVNDSDDEAVTDTYLNRLQGDIKKIVMIDEQRGGLALSTDVVGSAPFETADEQPYAGMTVELLIKYRHLRSDPTATG